MFYETDRSPYREAVALPEDNVPLREWPIVSQTPTPTPTKPRQFALGLAFAMSSSLLFWAGIAALLFWVF